MINKSSILLLLMIPSAIYCMDQDHISKINNMTFRLAIQTNNIKQVAKFLDINPSLIKDTQNSPINPLIDAITFGYADLVRLLLEKGADVTVLHKQGYTPLHLAAIKNDPQIVCYLLQHNANRSTVNKENKTPLNLAQEKLEHLNKELTQVTNNPPIQQEQTFNNFPFKSGKIPMSMNKENVVHMKKTLINNQCKVIKLLKDWPSYIRFVNLKKAAVLSTLLMAIHPRIGNPQLCNVGKYVLMEIAKMAIEQNPHHTLDQIFSMVEEGEKINFNLYKLLKK